MDRYLRSVIEDEFFASFKDLCKSPLYGSNKIRWSNFCLIEVSRCRLRRLCVGISFDHKLDFFFPTVVWSPLKLPQEVLCWPFAASALRRYKEGDISEVLAHEFGRINLLEYSESIIRKFDVNISVAQKEKSEEYRVWLRRVTKHPTWQEIMVPRALRYAKEAASISVNFGIPLVNRLCREFMEQQQQQEQSPRDDKDNDDDNNNKDRR